MTYKTVFIGDIHGRKIWKDIVNKENANRIIFIGDYFDSFNIPTEEQCNNFLDIIEYKKSSGKEVIMLIGNHDIHYITGDAGISGYQQIGKYQIEPIIKENLHHLQMCYQIDDIICTHAGVSSQFMDEVFGIRWLLGGIESLLNEQWKYKPDTFSFNGFDPYGDDTWQTPIWIRPKSLMKVNKKTLRNKIIQVVGHTSMESIDIKGKATAGRYYFIDTLDRSKEYLIFESKKFTVNRIE